MRNDEFEILIGINNIDTDVEKYLSYIKRIFNEEPAGSYKEIKTLEELNSSYKLTRK